MRRYIFILLFIPFLSAKAATPFVSVGVQPTLTRFRYEFADLLVDAYYNTFLSSGGVLSGGMKYGIHESYVRFSSTMSSETNKTDEETAYSNHATTRTYTTDRDRWQDRRLAIGHRTLIRQSNRDKINAFVGVAFSVGSGIWTQNHEQTIVTNYFESEEPPYSRTHKDNKTKYSAYSYGGFLEFGALMPIFNSIQLMATGQIGAAITAFDENDAPGRSRRNAGEVFEPAVSLALRWEIPNLDVSVRKK